MTDEPASYAEAEQELAAILQELDGAMIDVDVLTARVRRARELIQWCRDRVRAAELTVTELLAEDAEEG